MGHQKGKRRKMGNVKQDIFSNLPPEIITEILVRLPVQTIVRWKCVCKSWRNLFETRDFAKSHHSKSLVSDNLFETRDLVKSHHSKSLVFDDTLTVKYDEKDKIIDDLHVNTITKFYFNHGHTIFIQGSVDGFLLLAIYEGVKLKLHLCNPITREYIDLLHDQPFGTFKLGLSCYGFGVSKITGQYKMVGIFHQRLAEVYTIGSGSWRSVTPHANVHYTKICRGEFVNGNLHWLVDEFDFNGTKWISCFDLEIEVFSAFSPSPRNEKSRGMRIDVVENTLCLSDLTYDNYDTQIIIWMMKDYGVEKSWTKQFIIGRIVDLRNSNPGIYPIRFSKDGIIFMCYNNSLYYYSKKTKKTTKATCNFQGRVNCSHSYTPSFLSLKCFKMENVLSL